MYLEISKFEQSWKFASNIQRNGNVNIAFRKQINFIPKSFKGEI